MKWISVMERLPEPERPVFAMCSINDKQVAIRACWIPDKSKEDDGDYDGDSVYDEAQDKYFWPEGWYEWNLCEETHFFVDYPITHWLEVTGPEEEFCEWTEEFGQVGMDTYHVYNMGCGSSYPTIGNYCPNCGRPIKEIKQ